MLSKGSLWSHLKKLCCDYLALVQNEDSTDAEFDTVIDRAAETIAAQHEEELARARSEQTELLSCGHPASVVEDDGCQMCALERVNRWLMEQLSKSLAQVAVIQQAAERYIQQVTNGMSPACIAAETAEKKLQHALSAAPKVWRMQGRTSKYYDLEVVAEDAPDEFRRLLIARGMFAAWDVIVCPPKGEQPTESEQEATDETTTG